MLIVVNIYYKAAATPPEAGMELSNNVVWCSVDLQRGHSAFSTLSVSCVGPAVRGDDYHHSGRKTKQQGQLSSDHPASS